MTKRACPGSRTSRPVPLRLRRSCLHSVSDQPSNSAWLSLKIQQDRVQLFVHGPSPVLRVGCSLSNCKRATSFQAAKPRMQVRVAIVVQHHLALPQTQRSPMQTSSNICLFWHTNTCDALANHSSPSSINRAATTSPAFVLLFRIITNGFSMSSTIQKHQNSSSSCKKASIAFAVNVTSLLVTATQSTNVVVVRETSHG